MKKLGDNTKTAKAPKGWKNLILHLSPMNKAFKVFKAHREQVEKLVLKRMKRNEPLNPLEIEKIKAFNSCPWAGACGKYCLDTSGRGKFSNVQIARSAKTIHYALYENQFKSELYDEISKERDKAKKKGEKLAIRLNGTSDLDFNWLIFNFPDVQFYDYTKSRGRIGDFENKTLPPNYYLTYSYDRKNDRDHNGKSTILGMLKRGVKIAIMSKDYEALIVNDLKKDEPEFLTEFPLIDGDEHDLRFLDKEKEGGAFVILKEKGDAKK